jgi:type IV fimbrial biogenesis protein FimT
MHGDWQLGEFCREGESDEDGYTLVEFLVSIAILAIVSAIAAPSFSDLSASFDRMNARSNLLQDLKRAQAESLTKGCRGILVIADDGKSYSFGCDFLDYDTSSPPSHDIVSFSRALPRNLSISTSSQIIFNSRGQSVDETDVVSTVTITMMKETQNTPSVFLNGTLTGTGLFSAE